jgi:hypothetical protein
MQPFQDPPLCNSIVSDTPAQRTIFVSVYRGLIPQSKELTRGPPELVQHFRL